MVPEAGGVVIDWGDDESGGSGGQNTWPDPAAVLETQSWFQNGVPMVGLLPIPDPNACLGERRTDLVLCPQPFSRVEGESILSELEVHRFTSQIEVISAATNKGCC